MRSVKGKSTVDELRKTAKISSNSIRRLMATNTRTNERFGPEQSLARFLRSRLNLHALC